MKCLSAAELGPRPKRAATAVNRTAREHGGRITTRKRTKEHSFSLTATALHEEVEAARGEAARAYRQRSWSLRGLEHRRAGSCCAS